MPSASTTHADLIALTPTEPDWRLDWAAIQALWPEIAALDQCPQNPVYHAEGTVGTHTRLVVEALIGDPDWRNLAPDARSTLFWAAVLHDVGKPAVTTRGADGDLTSRGHSRVGANMARRLLWHAGAPFAWREAIAGLVAQHQLPFWLIERPDPRRLAIATSWMCRPDHLCLHAMADARGRICADQGAILEAVSLAALTFEEAECLGGPFSFANDESRVAYFERDDRDPHYAAHDAFRATVTVMSGLPGAGKDRWLARHRPDHPVVSLDRIRTEMGIAATANQGRVIQAAQERAREYLRAGVDFAWNATNVTRQTRARVLRLLRDYGARVEIVYIEVAPRVLYRQNRDRPTPVPEAAIAHLVEKLEPPALWEAHDVMVVA